MVIRYAIQFHQIPTVTRHTLACFLSMALLLAIYEVLLSTQPMRAIAITLLAISTVGGTAGLCTWIM